MPGLFESWWERLPDYNGTPNLGMQTLEITPCEQRGIPHPTPTIRLLRWIKFWMKTKSVTCTYNTKEEQRILLCFIPKSPCFNWPGGRRRNTGKTFWTLECQSWYSRPTRTGYILTSSGVIGDMLLKSTMATIRVCMDTVSGMNTVSSSKSFFSTPKSNRNLLNQIEN